MKKKILISLLAVVVIVGGMAALSAWEAHVINVIARIENALSVTPEEIAFGTVFPQEYLTKPLTISMSDSFLAEDRVDDIEYIIAQKPKPRNPEDWQYCLEEWESALDEVMGCFMYCYAGGGNDEYCWHQCKDILFNYADPEVCYPPLCPWLSKMPDGTPEPGNDEGVMPFEGIFDVAYGRLAKSEEDIEDTWIIDLIVSCFQGMCAQDYSWEEYGPPLPPEFEGETFGCDLWIEVTGISETQPGSECEPGETRLCPLQTGVCTGAIQTCVNGYWSSCDYGPYYEPGTEATCDDGKDNDCDGLTDCGDEEDCAEDPYCYNTSDALANAGWQYRKKITIDATKIDSNLNDFPVLVKLTSSNFDFSKARSDGHDIRFAQSDGTILLKYERERHDSTNQKAEYWVKASSVSSISNTEFYMYYGNGGASDGADPINVWDSNFKAVWHLNEDSGTRSDATTNGVYLTDNNTVGSGTGKIANGGDFEATNSEYLSHSIFLDTFPAGATFEAWIKPETVSRTQAVIQKTNVPLEDRMKLIANSNNTIACLAEGQNAGTVMIESSNTVTTGTWYYIAGTWAADDYPKVYLNTDVNTASTTVPQIQNGTWKDFTIGVAFSEPSETPAYYFDGVIDEARVSNTARSAAWLKASYNSGNNSLLTFGGEESI